MYETLIDYHKILLKENLKAEPEYILHVEKS